ncbi:MAG: putative Ig domain-containing protein [Candidatus Acidiferrales bacterium]
MTKRPRSALLAACTLFFCVAALINCSGTPAINYKVQLSPKGPKTIEVGQSIPLTANVLNDTTGAGVAWTLLPATAAGALNNVTTSGATYVTSGITGATAVQATVTATSITYPALASSLAITVQPAPLISPTTLTDGIVQTPYTATISITGGIAPFTWVLTGKLPTGLKFSSSNTSSVTISGTPTTAQTANFTIQVTDSVGGTNSAPLALTIDPIPPLVITTTSPLTNGVAALAYTETFAATGGITPYKWSVTKGSTLPSGLKLTSAGVLSGTPKTAGPYSFGITVTDSAKPADVTSDTFSLTISPAGTLAITTLSPLPDGLINSAYSLAFAATGGTGPYTWAVANASTLPTGLSLSTAGLLTGTPAVAGPNTFTITVTDSVAAMASAPFSLTVDATPPLTGSYAFRFTGYNTVGGVTGFVAAAGSFTIGINNIITGVEDFNSVNNQNFIGQGFTGDFTVGADGRGTLTFNNLQQGTTTFTIALDSTLSHGRMVEFDSTGIHGSGEIEKQSVTTCTPAAFNNYYALGLFGGQSASFSLGGPVAFAGTFQTDTTGAVNLAEADYASANQIYPAFFFSGATILSSGAQSPFCSVDILSSAPLSSINLNIYPYASNAGVITGAFLVETDPINNTTFAVLSGKLYQQNQLLLSNQNALTGPSVGGLTGNLGTFNGATETFQPDMYIAQLTGTGGSFTFNYTENLAGTVSTFNQSTNPTGPGGNYSVDQYGRITLTSGGVFPFVGYMIDANRLFAMTATNQITDIVFGELDPQSSDAAGDNGPYSATTIISPLQEGTIIPAGIASPNYSGNVTLNSTTGAVGGTQDTSLSTTNTPNQSIVGTYSNINSTSGYGNYSLTSPSPLSGVFYIVSPTKMVILTTTSQDTNPVVIVLGN